MRLTALLAVLVILFGCTGPEIPPVQNGTPVNTNTTNQTITIIVGPQTNQTAGENVTNVTITPQPNQTEPTYAETPNATLGIYFIDVGSERHGSAILVKKGGLDVLIDAGPAENSARVIDLLRSREVDDINLLISTNADPRNYGGINTVADSFKIRKFWWNGGGIDDAAYSAMVRRMATAPDGTAIVERGTSVTLNGITFEVLNPPKGRFGDVNNDAIVIRLTDRNFSVLLTSGIQTGAQGKLIGEQSGKIKAQVMQAPYYGVGAGTSQIGLFLVNAKPKSIIITGSADESAANGGSRDPFRRLMAQYNISWYETYANGTLKVMADGRGYVFQYANGTDITPYQWQNGSSSTGPDPGTGALTGEGE